MTNIDIVTFQREFDIIARIRPITIDSLEEMESLLVMMNSTIRAERRKLIQLNRAK